MLIHMKIPQNKIKINKISLIALDIRSSENVGAFFRTGDALGISQLYLVGITPNVYDKFNKPNPKISKTALGAENSVAYSYHKTITPLVNKLRKENYIIVALEQDAKSIDYRELTHQIHQKYKDKDTINIALIVGNEVTGVPQSVLKKIDYTIEIPMRGQKESLNVSVATGIALAEITRTW